MGASQSDTAPYRRGRAHTFSWESIRTSWPVRNDPDSRRWHWLLQARPAKRIVRDLQSACQRRRLRGRRAAAVRLPSGRMRPQVVIVPGLFEQPSQADQAKQTDPTIIRVVIGDFGVVAKFLVLRERCVVEHQNRADPQSADYSGWRFHFLTPA